MSEPGSAILSAICAAIELNPSRGVVCVHLGARSSGYNYPNAARLVDQLSRRGFIVVNFSPTGVRDNNVIEVDATKISLIDTMELLRTLKSDGHRIF